MNLYFFIGENAYKKQLLIKYKIREYKLLLWKFRKIKILENEFQTYLNIKNFKRDKKNFTIWKQTE